MEDIKYPEEVKTSSHERFLVQFEGLRNRLWKVESELFFAIRAEAEKGRVYGHFC